MTPPSSEVMTQGEMTEQLWFVVDKGSFGPQLKGVMSIRLSSALLPSSKPAFVGELCT